MTDKEEAFDRTNARRWQIMYTANVCIVGGKKQRVDVPEPNLAHSMLVVLKTLFLALSAASGK